MLGLASSARAILQKFLAHIRENNLLKPNTSILIALSGGPDSVFLLYLLNSIKDKFNLRLYASHVNYNLRGEESREDKNFCEKICNRFSIPIFINEVDLTKEKSNLQHKARQIRYNFFNKIAKKYSIDCIATAHTLDDQVEEVLIRLIRGASLDGLSGIKPKRGRIIRPILNFSKNEIINFLNTQKIPYRVDSSNTKLLYLRNKIRLKLLPFLEKYFNPNIKQAILNTTRNIYNDYLFIKKYSLKVLNNALIEFKKNEYAKINLIYILNEPENIRLNVYKYLLKKLLFYSENITTNSLKSIDKLIRSNKKNALINISDNIFCLKEYSTLKITKKLIEIPLASSIIIDSIKSYDLPSGRKVIFELQRGFLNAEKSINYPKDIWISKAKVNFPLILRKRQPGDMFKPLGMQTYVKLKDFLINRKVPMSLRNDYCVLTNNIEIIAIIGVEVSETYKVNGDEESIKISISL